jgi:DNA-binding CsgD family transcriptional regulator
MAITASRRIRGAVALEAIERLAGTDTSAQHAIEEIVRRVTGVVQADGLFAAATDPDTGLCLGAGMACNIDESVCLPVWEHEYLIPDFNKFADLTPDDPVSDLRLATGGRLSRSARYRLMSSRAGMADEVRVALHAGGRSWGYLQLNRHTGGQPFTDADRAFLRAAAPLAGTVLRRALLEEPARTDPTRGPGMAVLDRKGNVVSTTPEAEAWLGELGERWQTSAPLGIHPEVMLLSMNIANEPGTRTRRVRLRTLNGTWLIVQASPLVGTDQIAMIIEPAKASEIAPLVVQAYGLTGREVEVTRLIARGLSTDEVAAMLFLSRHTIRDHLKAIFEKTGVCSRGELTSKLFTEHYHQPLHDAVLESAARAADGEPEPADTADYLVSLGREP